MNWFRLPCHRLYWLYWLYSLMALPYFPRMKHIHLPRPNSPRSPPFLAELQSLNWDARASNVSSPDLICSMYSAHIQEYHLIIFKYTILDRNRDNKNRDKRYTSSGDSLWMSSTASSLFLVMICSLQEDGRRDWLCFTRRWEQRTWRRDENNDLRETYSMWPPKPSVSLINLYQARFSMDNAVWLSWNIQ